MIHATKVQIRKWLETLLHIRHSPHRTASAFALAYPAERTFVETGRRCIAHCHQTHGHHRDGPGPCGAD